MLKGRKYNYLLLLGHFASDINQGALPALIPFLIKDYDLSYAKAAGIIFGCNLVSSIVQPLFGHLGDKFHNPKLICLALLFAGGGIALMGYVTGYLGLFLCAVLSGIGVALFHPEGSKLTNHITKENKALGMSIFSVGGTLGFAVGPIIAVFSILFIGMKGLILFFIICVIVAIIFYIFSGKIIKETDNVLKDEKNEELKNKAEGKETSKKKNNYGAFTLVSIAVCLRSMILISLNTFIPLVLIYIVGLSTKTGSFGLSLFAATGAVGTMFGGYLTAKIGKWKVIMGGTILIIPCLFLFAFNTNLVIAIIIILFMAVFQMAPHPSLVVAGQEFMPTRIGLASGVLFGLTVSIGGMIAPVIGSIGDTFGLQASIFSLGLISIVALVFVLLVPKKKENKQE